MKKYIKLEIPNDSAWGRRTWRRYLYYKIVGFIDGIKNILDWLPTIWKDRHWDDYYILKILQRKIELQRSYLIKNNRHVDIDRDNFWMTCVLNLIERELEKYYEVEHQSYYDMSLNFIPSESRPGSYEVETEYRWEKFEKYFALYPSSLRSINKKHPNLEDKSRLAFLVSEHNQTKCRNLIFEILKQKSSYWWD